MQAAIIRWLEKHKIHARPVGKLWKFKVSEVDEWVKKSNASLESSDQDFRGTH